MLLNLHDHVYYITNVDILITLYFYVCSWNMMRGDKIKSINKTFIGQIIQVQYYQFLQVIEKNGMQVS